MSRSACLCPNLSTISRYFGMVALLLPITLAAGCGYWPFGGSSPSAEVSQESVDTTSPSADSTLGSGETTAGAGGESSTATNAPSGRSGASVSLNAPANATPRPLMIGSFNIERFGDTKSKNEKVMHQLMEVIYPFDVMAIQEVQSQKEAVIQNFVAKLNEKYNARFNYVIGPFVGRTSYVERFAFIYDTSRVRLVEQPFIVSDPNDKLHREPLVARFQVRDELSPNPFSFVLVNLHLDPKDGVAEMDHVSDILNDLQSLFAGQEDDILLIGDFNLSPGKIASDTRFGGRTEWKTVLDDSVMTNTRKNNAYDNIVYHTLHTQEFLQRHGTIDLQARFQISLDEALEISDHLPVWAAFSLHEATPHVASDPAATLR